MQISNVRISIISVSIFVVSQIDKNRTYSLQRLIRGLGASSSSSRSGFYTTLVGLLSQVTADEYPSVSQVIEVMEKELSVSKAGCNSKVSRRVHSQDQISWAFYRTVFNALSRKTQMHSSDIFWSAQQSFTRSDH